MRFPGRRPTLVLTMVAALSLGGCRDFWPPASLHPVLTDEQIQRPDGIAGAWGEPDGEVAFTIRPGTDGRYLLTDAEKESAPESYQLRFGRVGEKVYWEMAPDKDHDVASWPVHVPARIVLEGDTLEVAFLDGRRLREGLETGELSVAHSIVDRGVLLTASTAELQAFLAANAWREDLWDTPERFVRR